MEVVDKHDVNAFKQLVTLENVNNTFQFDYTVVTMKRTALQLVCFYWRASYEKADIINWLVKDMGALLPYALHSLLCSRESPLDHLFVKQLIELKADVNEAGVMEHVPLTYACYRPSCVKGLIDAGADVNHRSGPFARVLSNSHTRYDKSMLAAESSKLMMHAGARLKNVDNKSIIPSWAIRYESQLDTKWRNCVRAARELLLITCRQRIPKDVRVYLVRTWVITTWLDDKWKN